MRTVRCSDRRGDVYPSIHWAGVSVCVSQHALGRGESGLGVSATHTPCEQNHRRLWKQNLAVDGNNKLAYISL